MGQDIYVEFMQKSNSQSLFVKVTGRAKYAIVKSGTGFVGCLKDLSDGLTWIEPITQQYCYSSCDFEPTAEEGEEFDMDVSNLDYIVVVDGYDVDNDSCQIYYQGFDATEVACMASIAFGMYAFDMEGKAFFKGVSCPMSDFSSRYLEKFLGIEPAIKNISSSAFIVGEEAIDMVAWLKLIYVNFKDAITAYEKGEWAIWTENYLVCVYSEKFNRESESLAKRFGFAYPKEFQSTNRIWEQENKIWAADRLSVKNYDFGYDGKKKGYSFKLVMVDNELVAEYFKLPAVVKITVVYKEFAKDTTERVKTDEFWLSKLGTSENTYDFNGTSWFVREFTVTVDGEVVSVVTV